MNHIARNCRIKRSNFAEADQNEASAFSVHIQSDNLLKRQIRVSNKKVNAIFDTSAQVSICSLNTAKKHNF